MYLPSPPPPPPPPPSACLSPVFASHALSCCDTSRSHPVEVLFQLLSFLCVALVHVSLPACPSSCPVLRPGFSCHPPHPCPRHPSMRMYTSYHTPYNTTQHITSHAPHHIQCLGPPVPPRVFLPPVLTLSSCAHSARCVSPTTHPSVLSRPPFSRFPCASVGPLPQSQPHSLCFFLPSFLPCRWGLPPRLRLLSPLPLPALALADSGRLVWLARSEFQLPLPLLLLTPILRSPRVPLLPDPLSFSLVLFPSSSLCLLFFFSSRTWISFWLLPLPAFRLPPSTRNS